jgi:tetratricopeptide (TPR) repeat protein
VNGERYYFYHLDLGHPDTVRNWQDLQRAEREEARQAAAEAQNLHQWQRRKLQLLRANSQATEAGIAALRAGKFREALIALTRAADLDEGDPICRIHLVQARVALGHDAEAARVLRRALELQPKLVSLRLNLETYYAEPGVLDDHVNALKTRVKRRRNAPHDLHFLLGFLEFQRGHYDDAYGQFARIASAEPGDEYVQKYLELTRPAGR